VDALTDLNVGKPSAISPTLKTLLHVAQDPNRWGPVVLGG
jgi:hypothetical protein